MALNGIGNSPFGTLPVAPARPVVDRSARERTEFGSKESGDARVAFDADLQAMLGEAPPVSNGSTAVAANATGNARLAETYSPARTTPPTYTAQGKLADSLSKSSGVLAAPVSGANLASQPAAVPAGTEPSADASSASSTGSASSSSPASTSDKGAVKTPGELSQAEQEQVSELQQRDQEVRAHEQAHQATGGEHAGGVSYTYQRGPDNRQYAVGGSVPIDVSPVPDDPEATVQKAEKVRAAAMAPASPSGQDQQVAARASQMAAKARSEQAEKQLNPEKNDEVGGLGNASAGSATSGNTSSAETSKPDASDAGKAAAAGITAMAGGNTATITGNSGAAARKESPATAVKDGLAATTAQPAATTPPQDTPRPLDLTDAMNPESRNGSVLEAAYSPSAQATRAAFAALGSLNSLDSPGSLNTANRSAETGLIGSATNRAMNRATAAYIRVRGENGLAPANTGISMSV